MQARQKKIARAEESEGLGCGVANRRGRQKHARRCDVCRGVQIKQRWRWRRRRQLVHFGLRRRRQRKRNTRTPCQTSQRGKRAAARAKCQRKNGVSLSRRPIRIGGSQEQKRILRKLQAKTCRAAFCSKVKKQKPLVEKGGTRAQAADESISRTRGYTLFATVSHVLFPSFEEQGGTREWEHSRSHRRSQEKNAGSSTRFGRFVGC
mmetsp:Transcript_2052/g.4920  ORF Transcript_2052/g.4920 Transcript_2052/m.4920 type:complete len:206 (+) Transcript_2052:356-973(+)